MGASTWQEFDATLVKMFGQAEIEHIFTLGGNLRDAVHYARQTTTASIVNSSAQYYIGIRNQKRAFNFRQGGMGQNCDGGLAQRHNGVHGSRTRTRLRWQPRQHGCAGRKTSTVPAKGATTAW